LWVIKRTPHAYGRPADDDLNLSADLSIFLRGGYLMGSSIRAHFLFKELETLQLGHSTFPMGARAKQPQHNNLPKWKLKSKVRKYLDTTSIEDRHRDHL
jgi:hypothetical protein